MTGVGIKEAQRTAASARPNGKPHLQMVFMNPPEEAKSPAEIVGEGWRIGKQQRKEARIGSRALLQRSLRISRLAACVGRGWYSWVGSNHRPPVPQTGALTN